MDRIINNAYIRRIFYLFFGMLLLLFIGLRVSIYLYFVEFSEFILILDNLISSLIIIALLGGFFLYLAPKLERRKIEVVEANRTQRLLGQKRLRTTFWYYSGSTGSFTRSVELPELAKLSKKMNRPMDIRLLILDPDNWEICAHYSKYKRGLKGEKKEGANWTVSHVRNQSFATIVKAILLSNAEPLLNISIGLKNHFSLFKTNIYSKAVIITNEDPRRTSLSFSRGTSSYNGYIYEFIEAFKQSRQLPQIETQIKIKDLNRDKLLNILTHFSTLKDVSDKDLDEILSLVKAMPISTISKEADLAKA